MAWTLLPKIAKVLRYYIVVYIIDEVSRLHTQFDACLT